MELIAKLIVGKDRKEFEQFLEGIFRTQGYSIENIRSSGDHGVDLIVTKDDERTGVQAKRYKPNYKISSDVLHKLKGGGYFHDCEHLLVVTTSYFTKSAIEFANAEKVGIELWDRNNLKQYLRKYNDFLNRQ